jgi:RNA polymerase sigma factor (TIGR02999 family)
MTTPLTREVTEFLTDLSDSDREAYDKLVQLVYKELHRLAHHYMSRERLGHTLQTTALVDEVYLRLIDQRVRWQSQTHFCGVAAQMMRRILVDHARTHGRQKRGGGAQAVSLDEAASASHESPPTDLVALDETLRRLAEIDPQKSRIVELRFFGGLSVEETAAALGVSVTTVKRHWSMARAWLYREMSDER